MRKRAWIESVWVIGGLVWVLAACSSDKSSGDDAPDGSVAVDASTSGSGGAGSGGDAAGNGSAGDAGNGTAGAAGHEDAGAAGSNTDPVNCVAVGEACLGSFECCGGRTCEADANGHKRCTDQSFCKAGGEACGQASECCSLSCDGTCQDGGGLCKPAGDECASDTECCSNDCDGTCQTVGSGCATAGERCDSEGYDADCCSAYCVDFGDVDSPDLRCGRQTTCGARGEICVADSDCCSGVCLDGRCPTQDQVGQKRYVGEPCQQDSDCASYACAATYQGGPKVCQFLGGCRPAEEICTEDWQCCGYMELSASRDACMTAEPVPGACRPVDGVPGLSTCALQTTDKEVGEICESGGEPVHDCCGGPEVCQESLTGVKRCLGPGGGECLGDGEPCSIADQCCSQVCAPSETEDGTVLVCSACRRDGEQCTTNADCCDQQCVDGVCETPPAPPGDTDGGAGTGDAGTSTPSPSCIALGASCSEDGDCCSGICDGTCKSIVLQ